MTSGLVLGVMAAAATLLGRAGWRHADDWAAQAWDDAGEQARKRASLRRGAVACLVVAGALAVGAVVSVVAAVV
jgi:hypothetical protein